jgi:hypothetical protein
LKLHHKIVRSALATKLKVLDVLAYPNVAEALAAKESPGLAGRG